MLKIYRDTEGTVRSGGADDDLPGHVIWMDLLNPDEKEIEFVRRRAKVRVPTREALSEIEASSRLSKEGNRIYLSAPVIAHATLEHAELSPAGFIVGRDFLITVRYDSQAAFDAVAERLVHDATLASGMGVFVALLEAIVDRGADVPEHLASAVDEVSKTVFKGDLKGSASPHSSNFTLRRALSKVGALGDRSSKARDVLLGVGRMAAFTLDVCHDMLSDEFRDQLHAVTKDVASLSDYETHLSDKTQFLLDAVLGFITIEQNDIFKVLTIASVVGVPPTLMAGVWGMNFKFMPELSWTWGYPFAWAIIILSAVAPLLWFWRKGWF